MPTSLNKNIDMLCQSFTLALNLPMSLSENKPKYLRSFILIICILYSISETFYLLRGFSGHMSDLTLYHSVSSKILDGNIPFRDFPIEYPVLAIIPILIPALVNQIFSGTLESYCVLFVIQNFLLSILTGYTISRTQISGVDSKYALFTYTLLLVFALPVYLFRYDAFPVLLTSVMVYTVFQKPFFSGMTLAASIMAKLYPIVIAPAIALYYMVNWLPKRGLLYLSGFLAFSIISLAFILPFTGSAIFNFAQPHQLRGIQLESVIGGFLLLANKLNMLSVTITHNYGSYNIDSPVSQAIVGSMTWGVGVIFLLIFLFQSWLFFKERQAKGVVSQMSLIIAMNSWLFSFLIFNKVLSPQYVLWILPLIPFLNQTIKIKFFVALMLTITIFPGWYHYLMNVSAFLVVLLNIRNLLLIWILIDIIKLMINQVFTANPTHHKTFNYP
jgi:hypothetical protein